MGFRDKLNSPIFTVLAILLIGAGVVLFIKRSTGNPYKNFGDTVWVYNLDTGELIRMANEDAIPPIRLSDGTGYKAVVFSCGQDGSGEPQVAYLSKYTPEAVEALGDDGVIDSSNFWVEMNPARSTLIATVESAKQDQWIPATTANIDKLLSRAVSVCGGVYQIVRP